TNTVEFAGILQRNFPVLIRVLVRIGGGEKGPVLPLHVLLILVVRAVAPTCRKHKAGKGRGLIVDTLHTTAVVRRLEGGHKRRAQELGSLIHLARSKLSVGEVDREQAVRYLRGLTKSYTTEGLAVEVDMVLPDQQRARARAQPLVIVDADLEQVTRGQIRTNLS